ncbi:MAG: DUF4738 domain-containing protein [Bacteroidaceae bacterium]|nr:DUF4738 domain-containing protein [Bacteroidaceae bacterium]
MRIFKNVCFFVVFFLVACNGGANRLERIPEDKVAKELLQGVWIDDSNDFPLFMVSGDTLRYVDENAKHLTFKIIQDSLYLMGIDTLAYKIERQGENIFWIKSGTYGLMKLHRSDYEDDKLAFDLPQEVEKEEVIQEYVEKDSVIVYNGTRFRGYVFINPTQYKVVRTSYDEIGIGIERVYYDNIIHICVYDGAQEIFGRDIDKFFFKDNVAEEELAVSVLSDMDFSGVDDSGYHYQAILTVPDSPVSHHIHLIISPKGDIQIDEE